jgi:hypothetical protein
MGTKETLAASGGGGGEKHNPNMVAGPAVLEMLTIISLVGFKRKRQTP